MSDFTDALERLRPVDPAAAAEAAAHHDRLTKPQGSLGRIEAMGIQLAAIAGTNPPPLPTPAAVAVFAGDHGVLDEGVSPWPQEVTGQMVANFSGGGAAVNVLARHVGAIVIVVDVGVAAVLPDARGLVQAKVRAGTGNLLKEPAMTIDEAREALDIGVQTAAALVARGSRCLLTGDMGIGNTTPSAALIAAFTGRPAREVTGRGTGIDDERWARKVEVVEGALARAAADGLAGIGGAPGERDALAILASLGGLEIAALAGYLVGAAAARVPVIVDGVIGQAAAVVAAALAPDVVGYLVAGHRSAEPGSAAALDHLGLEPLLDLSLRLGEGTGACLALPVLQASAKILHEMATFEEAGVTSEHD